MVWFPGNIKWEKLGDEQYESYVCVYLRKKMQIYKHTYLVPLKKEG